MSKKAILPSIPDKRYFTIGETGELCLVKPHVLRYWEQEFSQLRPMKRRGNRRYYQHKDIELVRLIRALLYEKGYTINGAKRELTQARKTHDSAVETSIQQTTVNNNVQHIDQGACADIVNELKQLLADLGETR